MSSGSGITPVTKITEYDDTHRFPHKQYTSPVSAVNTFTYDMWGNIVTESDETNADFVLTTTHTYDNWGFRTQTLSPLGLKTAYIKGWGTTADKRYYSWQQTAGEPWSKTWYDNKGREVAAESIGAKNLSIQTSTSYNTWGKVSEKQSQTGDLTMTEDFTYDARGRLSTQSNSTGQSSTITYGQRKITTVTNGRTYIKAYDEWGNLKTSIDPVDTVSYKYASSGKPKSVTSANATFSMTYDDVGNQRTLTDPNAGTTTYTYDAARRIIKQEDGRGKITQNIYDGLGRLSTATVDGATTTYTYGTSGNEAFRLVKQETAGNYTGYTYDGYGRVTTETQQVNGSSALNFGYSYNSLGQVSQISYPGSLTASYTYDSYGNKVKTQVGSQPIWELTGLTGTVTTSKLGGTLTSTETHDANGFLSNLKVENSSQVLHNMSFVFDEPTGNLTSRSGMLSQTETFAYDNLDRLTDVTAGGTNTMHLGYAVNGNISTKTGIGTYTYGSRPHAVTSVENAGGLILNSTQSTPFNAFGKIESISDTGNGYSLDFTYGPDQERWKTVLKLNGNITKTTIFAGDYEQVTAGGAMQRFYYLDGGAIYVKQDGQADKVYYRCTDHLGSIVKLVDGAGTEVFAATYDAWGKRMVTNNAFAFHRGFTGHEHLPEFDLINMNGRLYDPALGRFLSCDPYVQMPDFSQNFNRYSYCLNNPLKYNDPSGEFFGIDDAILAMAIYSALQQGLYSGAQSKMNGGNFWSGAWKGAAIGAASSLVPYGVGKLYGHEVGTLGTELLRAGTHGVANGLLNMAEGGKFGVGFATGVAASFAGSAAQHFKFSTLGVIGSTTLAGAGASALFGGDWMAGAMQGMSIGANNFEGAGSPKDPQRIPEVTIIGHRISNLTNAFNSQLMQTRAFFSSRRKFYDNISGSSITQMGFFVPRLYEFYSLVKTGGLYDFKYNKESSFSYIRNKAGVARYNNELFRMDDFGNYNFGVAAKAYGVPLDAARVGAGLYQINEGTSSLNYFGSYFDDPRDYMMITRGYYHFK